MIYRSRSKRAIAYWPRWIVHTFSGYCLHEERFFCRMARNVYEKNANDGYESHTARAHAAPQKKE